MGVGRMKKRSCMPLVSRKIAQTGVALLVLFVLAALFRGRASERARWPQEAGQIKYSNFAKRMARAKQQRIIIWRKCAKEAVTGGVPGWAGWLGRPWMFGNVRIFFCFSFVCVYFGLILVRFHFFFFGGGKACKHFQSLCCNFWFLRGMKEKIEHPEIFAHKEKAINCKLGLH